MTDSDPLKEEGYQMDELFAHNPSEFEITPWKLSWTAPCWLNADIVIRPLSPATREKFFPSLSMPHTIDAFARVSWRDQLSESSWERLRRISGPHENDWWVRLNKCYEALDKALSDTGSLFPEPFRLVCRPEFTTVDLATILKQEPSRMNVYLAEEKGSYHEYFFLRIHSAPPFLGATPKCLWFEKRLPGRLHPEDILPWFVAAIQQLPKKHQPAIDPWTERLLEFEPQLAFPLAGSGNAWLERPKLVLVFGPMTKIGSRCLTHFERRDIAGVVRQHEIIKIEGMERYVWKHGNPMEVPRTFYLLALDSSVAERVEHEILNGHRIHFGLDGNILGMICHSGHVVSAINAPLETIQKLCVPPGLDLRLLGDPKEKVKMYELISNV